MGTTAVRGGRWGTSVARHHHAYSITGKDAIISDVAGVGGNSVCTIREKAHGSHAVCS